MAKGRKARRAAGKPAWRSPERGTPEAERKRQQLVGGAADPALAENALGVVRAHGGIDDEGLRAGHEFAQVWAMKYAPPGPVTTGWGRWVAGSAEGEAEEHTRDETWDERQVRVGAKFDAALRALQDAGGDALQAVRQVAVFGRAPGRDVSREALRRGLDALARHWGFRTVRTGAGRPARSTPPPRGRRGGG
jgi:hypothetical protein